MATNANEYEELEQLNKGVVEEDPGQPANEEPKKEEEAPKEEPKEEPKPEEAPKEEPKHEEEPPERPERYIPLPKYHAEKDEWKKEKEAYEKRISELETLNRKPESDSKDDAIRKYAEKHGVDEDSVRDLLAILPKGQDIPPDALELLNEAKTQRQLQAEQEHFTKEFEGVSPLIKERFPEADDSFIAKVRDRLNELAHTKELARTPLAYIFHAHAGEFAPSAPQGRKSAESGRPGAASQLALTAADFKGKKDFTDLMEADDDTRKKVVADMDPDTWANFVQWSGQQQEQGLEVNRNGRKIVLK